MHHTISCRFAGCLALSLLLLPPEGRGAAGPRPSEELATRARNVLRTHCAACHGPGGSGKGGFDYLLDRDRLVARNQVIPGQATGSALYQRVAEGEMPPPGKRRRPAPDEVALLRRWIDAGAPPFGSPAFPPALVDDSALLRTVLADLRALEPRQRRFVRYLTLTHLANTSLPAEELETARHALAKLVNSLSWHPRITRPRAVDPARTVYRIDLRAYRWNPRLWERLAAVYPYRLVESNPAARECAALTGSDQPVLRADWFVATAARPPFYHEFLQLPSTDRGLERLLQVDVPGDLKEDGAVRAGFNGSGVARNNRVIERHDAAHGAYWRSYDFSDNTGRQNIFERPLGPAPGPLGFTHAAGEIIFHLPNGLQGYLLVDANGRRVDRAPSSLVSDPSRPDRLVENGLSCIGCHAHGLLPRDDQVRAHVLKNPAVFSRADRAAALALYVPAVRLRELMKEDQERFAHALARAGVPAHDPEPILALTQGYEAVLDLRTAAGESGLTAADFARRLQDRPELARSLGTLLAPGGTVQRQVFEETFPELARHFRLGADAEDRGPTTTSLPFTGHKGSVRGLAFAPDGRRAASGGADRTIRVWDVRTGWEMYCFEGHTDEVADVVFSADGRRLLSGGQDRTVRLWDLSGGKEARRFLGHTDAVRAVALSHDGTRALSGGADRTLRLWDIKDGRELLCLVGHTAPVTAVAFSPDGRLALSGSEDRTVRLWDLSAGKGRDCWDGHTGEVYSVAFSPDGRLALSGGNDRVVRLWDVGSGKEVRRFTGHANAVIRVAFGGDGRLALSGSSQYQNPDRVVRGWDLATGTEVGGLDGAAPGRIEGVAFTRDGSRALLAEGAGTLRLWPLPRR